MADSDSSTSRDKSVRQSISSKSGKINTYPARAELGIKSSKTGANVTKKETETKVNGTTDEHSGKSKFMLPPIASAAPRRSSKAAYVPPPPPKPPKKRQTIFMKIIEKEERKLERWRMSVDREYALEQKRKKAQKTIAQMEKEKPSEESIDLEESIKDSLSSLSKQKDTASVSKKSSGGSASGTTSSGEESGNMAELEEQVTRGELERLNKVFDEAGEREEAGLNMMEFRRALRESMPGTKGIPDHELDMIFMKVDTNCDGTVDWEEFVSYMLLEFIEKDMMYLQSQSIIPEIGVIIPSPHRDSMVRIECFNKGVARLTLAPDVLLEKFARYVSASQEGVLCFWDLDFTLTKSGKAESFKGSAVWVMDIVVIPRGEFLGVATSDLCILWYNIAHTNFERVSQIVHLPACPTVMRHYVSVKEEKEEYIFIGDERGGLTTITLSESITLTDFNCKAVARGETVVQDTFDYQDIVDGKMKYLKAEHIDFVHKSDVRNLMYLYHLDYILTCCKFPETSMCMRDRKNEISPMYFDVNHGVNTCDYHKGLNVIVSGGFDAVIRVWNAYVNSAPVIFLSGHQNPILRLHIHQEREAVLSLAEMWEVYVWDLNSQTCLQQVVTKHLLDAGPRYYSGSFLHQDRNCLVAGTTKIVVFEKSRVQEKDLTLTSHAAPVAQVLYNPLFKRVVTAGWDSLVAVWDLVTGNKEMQFRAHRIEENGVIKDYEITAMAFDTTYRRLLTGCCDGTLRIWNFHNGALLRELHDTFDNEISSILCCQGRIFTGGWSKYLTMSLDRANVNNMQPLVPSHLQDLTSLAYDPQTDTLASSSYDGDIFLWTVSSLHLSMCLNHTVGQGLPLSAWYAADTNRRNKTGKSDFMYTFAHMDMSVREQEDIKSQLQIFTSNSEKQWALLGDNSKRSFNRLDGKPSSTGSFKLSPSKGKMLASTSKLEVRSQTDQRFKSSTSSKLAVKAKSTIVKINDKSTPSSEPKPKWGYSERYPDIDIQNIEELTNVITVVKMCFIPGRTVDPKTVTLMSACTNGCVHAWSIHVRGGLLGTFHASRSEEVGLTAMAVSSSGEYLVTGDNDGYFKVWYIGHYLKCDDGCSNLCTYKWQHYRMTKWRNRLKEHGMEHVVFYPDPPTLHLLTSIRGHTAAITCLEMVDLGTKVFVLSGGPDCSVRMWTAEGDFVGIFGQIRKFWNLSSMKMPVWRDGALLKTLSEAALSIQYRQSPTLIPPDVRKIGSATTLFVLNARKYTFKWLAVILVIRWLLEAKVRERLAMMKNLGKLSDRDEKLATKAVLGMKRYLQGIRGNQLPILGKSYKKKLHYRPLPPVIFPPSFPPNCPAFRALPYSDVQLHGNPSDQPDVQAFQRRWRLPPLENIKVVDPEAANEAPEPEKKEVKENGSNGTNGTQQDTFMFYIEHNDLDTETLAG